MNMQIAAVAALFAVLTAIPQTVLGQSQFNSIPSSAAPQYESYGPAYYNGFQAPEQYYQNGISAQGPASFQGYYEPSNQFQGQYPYSPYSNDGQSAGAPYADAASAYQSPFSQYPYPYQQQEQLQQQV